MDLDGWKVRGRRRHEMLNGKGCQGSCGRTKGGLPVGIAAERMVVLTETVAVAAFVPSMDEDMGEKAHAEAMGAPVHVQDIVWLNPPEGAAETEKFAICPAVIVEPEGAATTL